MKKNCTNFFLFIFLIFISFGANAQIVNIINTVAGNNTSGYSGDLGPANNAQINNPSDVALDASGNLYIADFYNNVIRIVTTSGIIGTYAGTGFGAGAIASGAYSGDGGPATAAELNGPYGIALDTLGNVYFADGYNHVVRKIYATTHTIVTFAGNGAAGYTGNGGLATAAELDNPVGIAIDRSGNVYIADDHNHVIREVNTSGIISTFAGNDTMGYRGDGGPATAAEFNLPIGLAFDGLGNLYIADENNNDIRKVNTLGIISTFVAVDTAHGYSGDGGPATAASLYAPAHIAVGNTSSLYISDEANNVVRIVDIESGIINTFAGDYYGPDTAGTFCEYGGDTGPATAAQMCVVQGVAVGDSGKVYIADRDNQVIRLVSPYSFAGVKPVQSVGAATLKAYPNPSFGGDFTINLASNTSGQVLFTVTNLLGATITEMKGTTNSPVDLKLDAPPGVYFLRATTAEGSWNMQIVAER